MILYTKITLQQLSKEGKNHKWGTCPCTKCDRNMWGHGYVARYFTEVSNAVHLKKYRCPNCRVVVIVKPEGFWRFIFEALFLQSIKCFVREYPKGRGLLNFPGNVVVTGSRGLP